MEAVVKKKSREFNSKKGWKEIDGKKYYFKSSWEYKYAKYLFILKKAGYVAEWFYEPQIFWFLNIKRGIRSYTPDFKVVLFDRSHYWIEVKGYMDSKSKTKIKRFEKYYPQEKLCVIEKEWFKGNKFLR